METSREHLNRLCELWPALVELESIDALIFNLLVSSGIILICLRATLEHTCIYFSCVHLNNLSQTRA